MRPREAFVTLAALAAFLLPLTASGEDLTRGRALAAGFRDIDDVSLEDLLRVPITAAARHEQEVGQAASSATVITAGEIEAGGYETLAQVLQGLAGFYASDDLNYTYVGVRGFSPPGDYNMRILVLIDGHPMNDVIWASSSVGTDGPIDLGLVDRIEVVRGPGSALYGTSAILAVVQIVTKDAARKSSPGGFAETGSYGRRGGGFLWSGPLGSNADLLLSASGMDRKGPTFHFSEFGSTPSGGVTDKDADRVGRFYGVLHAGAFRLCGLRSSRTKHLPTGAWESIFDDPATRTTDTREYVEAVYTRAPLEDLEVSARAFADRYISDGVWPYDASMDSTLGVEGRVISRDESEVVWGGAEIRAGWRPSAIHRLSGGGGFHIDRGSLLNLYENIPPGNDLLTLDIHKRSSFYSFHAQEEYAPTHRFSLTLGLHYDHYQTWGGTVTPRIGIVAEPAAKTRLKVLFGQGFRAPSMGEVFYDDGATEIANPDLGPERIVSWEGVVEHSWASFLWTRLSAYRNEISNLIELAELDSGLLQYRNVGKVGVDGLEVDVQSVLREGVRARANAAYQYAEDEARGGRVRNSPKWTGNLGAQASVLGRRFLVGIDGRYVGERLGTNGWSAGAYVTADANIVWRTPVSGLRVSLKVNNLADRAYADPAGSGVSTKTIPQYGRVWRLAIHLVPAGWDSKAEESDPGESTRPEKAPGHDLFARKHEDSIGR